MGSPAATAFTGNLAADTSWWPRRPKQCVRRRFDSDRRDEPTLVLVHPGAAPSSEPGAIAP
jgi:hypothetical protein